ncbi:hypothetical protein JTB14_006784 [Gonioctena quinquepunctata]|nr:hypothetical protein JTB14_006784 [Gonioctena quinquepunctata]
MLYFLMDPNPSFDYFLICNVAAYHNAVRNAKDLTQQQREEQTILRKHLSLAKRETSNECYIRGNKLFVNGVAYNAENLQERSDHHSDQKSAPATPTVQHQKSLLETSDTPNNQKSETREKVQRIPLNQPRPQNTEHNKEESTSKPGKQTKQQNKPDANECEPRTRSITKPN